VDKARTLSRSSAADEAGALPPPVKLPLTVIPDHPCPYLPGRLSKSRAFAADSIPADLYHQFMDANFRRSGTIFYQPVCDDCRACMQIRVPVPRFAPSKSQRRCMRRNADVRISVERCEASAEGYDLYVRYISQRHDGKMSEDWDGYESFLCRSPVETVHVHYRDAAGKLLAVGVCDLSPKSLSSVYFYFDPDEERRSLGTFGALIEIELARKLNIPHYYLGYWVRGCRKMEYKANYTPCEVLHADGVWRGLTDR
jgi:leucyl-tRNA---protein transferase